MADIEVGLRSPVAYQTARQAVHSCRALGYAVSEANIQFRDGRIYVSLPTRSPKPLEANHG